MSIHLRYVVPAVVYALVSLLRPADAARTAHVDPAPVHDDVVRRLVHEPLLRQRVSLPDVLSRHLDEAVALVQQLERHDRAAQAGGHQATGTPTAQTLLGSKLHELQTTRAAFRTQSGQIRSRLTALGSADPVRRWDEKVARIEAKFTRVTRALTGVHQAKDRADRGRALPRARAELRVLHEDVKAQQVPPPTAPIPTFTQAEPTSQKPEPVNAPPPAYMASPRVPNNVYASLAPILLAAAPPTPSQAQACGYTNADVGNVPTATPEIPITNRASPSLAEQEIRKLAADLGNSPVRIFQYVANEIAFEPYYGSLKGALGTQVSKAGNATDQASLLIALLRASNIPARYVKGTAQFFGDARILRWVGAKDYAGAAKILGVGQIPFNNGVSGTTPWVVFTHGWVEACLPYGNYRGTAFDLSGYRWVPLDPSFKDKTYQPGIATTVNFDYTTYMGQRTNTLPHEAYAQQVETSIKAADANNTLADVGYIGRLVPRLIDILPASLPYQVIAFTAWDASGSAETADLPDTHRYKFSITVQSCAPPQSGCTGTQLAPTAVLTVPQIVLQRVTLSFQGATASDQATLDTWKNNQDLSLTSSPLPCGVNVVPVIRVEGTPHTTGTTPVDLCTTANQLTLGITLADAATPTNPTGCVVTLTSFCGIRFTNIQAGNYHALQAYAFQASDRLLRERAARLLASVRSLANPNTNQDETEGEYLHVTGLKYMRYISDALKRLGELDGGSGLSGNHLGLTSAVSKVTYLFDEPFAVTRSGWLIDMPGGLVRSVDLTTGAGVWKTFQLAGYSGSAYEAYIWQENARLDAVSTVRGVQFARETGIPVLTLTSANWATESPKLCTSAASPGCSAVPASLYYPSSTVTTLQNAVNGGFTVTAPRQVLQYQNWTGTIWVQEKNDTTAGTMQAGFIISGGYAGAYATLLQDATTPPPAPGAPPPPQGVVGTRAQTDATQVQSPSGNTTGGGTLPVTAGDPVNMFSGNMYHTERDLAIKGRGLPIVFERSYNSRAPTDGPLGFGWTHSFNHVLVFHDDNANGVDDSVENHDTITSAVNWVDGTGSEKFIQVAGANTSGIPPTGASFAPPQGFFFQVARNAVDGTYTLREKNGLTYTFQSVPGLVNDRARLERITDRNGNKLSLAYNAANELISVTDDVGRALTFTSTGGRITQVTDWATRAHQYGYDASGNLTTYKNPLAVAGMQNPVTYSYSSDPQLNHRMQSYTLPRGNGMTFEYYVNGRVFKHTTTLGETTTFTYNEFRREAIAVNERGHTRLFFFDAFGNPTKIVDETGGETTYTYDLVNRMNRLSSRDPMGYTTQYAYDANGNVTQVTLPSGNTVQYSFFNSFNQPGKIKDAQGNYTLLKYDAKGNLLEVLTLKNGVGGTVDPTTYVPPNPPSSQIAAWTINTYAATNGNLLTTRQVRDLANLNQTGPRVTFTYDAPGLNVVGITRCGDKNGDGMIAEPGECDTSPTLVYDVLGRVTTGLRPDWYQSQFVYDAVDRVRRANTPTSFTDLRDYTFDANGNLASETLTVNSVVVDQRTATYDLSDRRTTSTDAGGFVTTTQYDPAGNATQVTSPDDFSVAFDYDPANRVIQAADEAGHAVTITRDLAGKPRTVTDPNGHTVTSIYYGPERDGRLKQRKDPLGRVTTFDYDANGNVISVTDNLGRTTTTTYDELNRPVRIVGPPYTDPTSGLTIRPVTKTTYDALGRVVKVEAGKTDNTGTNPPSDVAPTQMTFTYDDFGRKLTETDPLGRSWAFEYDVQGNPIRVTDPRGTVTRATWAYGHQLLTRTNDAGTITYMSSTRNPLGQVTQAVTPDVTYSYTYDAAHRLATATDSRGGKQLTYTYTPGGRLLSLVDSEANRTDYLYDAVGRLAAIGAPTGDLVSFAYDPGGRLTEKWLPTGVSTRFTYNTDNTLAQLLNKMGSTVLSQHDYTYDGVGNRATHTELIAGTSTPNKYVYDPLDRLTEVRNNTTNALIQAYTYDPLGNRLTKTDGVTTLAYAYDAANQLTQVCLGSPAPCASPATSLTYDLAGNLTQRVDGSVTTTLTYDVLNRMTQAAVTGQSTQAYAYDDQGRRIRKTVGTTTTNYLYNGPDIIAEYTTWTSPAAQYTHGPNMDDPLLRATATATQYYHQDGLGSVVAVTNSSGATDGAVRYNAWGNRTLVSGSTFPPQYGYTGREPDETGLIFVRARYYDPTLGRFTQRDPVGLDGDDINLYAYVTNNPVNLTDPQGLCPVCLFLAGRAIVSGAVNVGIGYGIAKVTGQQYGLKQGLIDFAVGAVFSVPGSVSAVRQASKLSALSAVQKGQAGVQLAEREAVARGERVLATETYVRTPQGKFRADLIAENSSNKLTAVEAKVGPTAELSEAQSAGISYIQAFGTW